MMKLVDQANRDLIHEGRVVDTYGFLDIKTHKQSQTPHIGPTKLKKLEYYFLFSPKCIYGLEMAKTIVTLPNIIPLQVVGKKLFQFKGLPESSFATKDTINNYIKDGKVPVLVIYASSRKKAKVIKGLKSLSYILMESKKLLEEK